MIPVTYKMVDLNGLDLAEINGGEVPGIYNKIAAAYNTSRFAIMCNWFFAGIIIAPAHVLISQVENGFLLNDLISVKSDDTVEVVGLAPEPVIEELNVTENDIYTPEQGVDGFSPVIVNVPSPVLVQLTATENETYLPGTGEDGFSSVVVNVPAPVLVQLTATENRTYLPETGEDGFSSVVVNVPIPTPQNPTIEPVYSGLSYAFINGATFIEYTTKTNYLVFFEITAGDYIVFLDFPIGNRLRATFFSGKSYSDFEQYVENPGSDTIYSDGISIVNTIQVSEIEQRYKFTASSSGTLVVMTSSSSQTVKAYLMKQTN